MSRLSAPRLPRDGTDPMIKRLIGFAGVLLTLILVGIGLSAL